MDHPSFLFTVDGQMARTSSMVGYDSGINGLEGDDKYYLFYGGLLFTASICGCKKVRFSVVFLHQCTREGNNRDPVLLQ